MRREPTGAEAELWLRLRRNGLGVRFRRQHAIGQFVADFVCLAAWLIVELDGPIHTFQQERDSQRDAILRGMGYRVLRIPNERVLNEMEMVLEEIRAALSAAP